MAYIRRFTRFAVNPYRLQILRMVHARRLTRFAVDLSQVELNCDAGVAVGSGLLFYKAGF